MSEQNPFGKEHPQSILKSVVEKAIDGIFLMDSSGVILMCNPSGHRLFGYEPNELEGKDIKLVMPPPQRQMHEQIIGTAREIAGLRKDGTLFPARLALSEIIIDKQHYFAGIIHDLTEIKKVETELLRLNRELEELVESRTTELQDAINRLLDTNLLLNQSIEKHKAFESALLTTRDELKRSLDKEKELGHLKSRFISMASHEFKTPLSSILSSAALISRYDQTEQAEDRKRHVDRIKASVTHLNTILTDFLSITRLEEGRFQPQISRFKIDDLIADLLSEMEVLLKPQQALTFEYKTVELGMETDKNIVRNILYNLLSNAIKYSDANTSIRCNVKRKSEKIIIEIKDEGIGIPLQDRKHIGTRFFRSSNVTHLQGTGLGLNIVNSYLHFLGGTLTFKSLAAKGTTFTVTIPAVHEE